MCSEYEKPGKLVLFNYEPVDSDRNMPQEFEERTPTVQDILRKFETRSVKTDEKPNDGTNIVGYGNSHVPKSSLPKEPPVFQTSTPVDVCSWTTRRRRDQHYRPVTVRTCKQPVLLKGVPTTNTENSSSTQFQKQQIRVSEIAKLFQGQVAISPNDPNSVKLKCGTDNVSSGGGTVDGVDSETRPPTKIQTAINTVPPQKPVRTFAHDVYLKTKLLQGNSGSPRLSRARSSMTPGTAKPKLPPKPIRAQTVPPVKVNSNKSPQTVHRQSVKINRPRTPPPRPPPPGSSPPKSAYPNPYAISSNIVCQLRRPWMASSQARTDCGQKGRYGVLRRFHSEERVYDVPTLKRHGQIVKNGSLDKWKSSLVLDRLSDVVLVDNDVYQGGGGDPKVVSATNSKERSSLGQGSRQELHYMSSPIITDGRHSEFHHTYPGHDFWRLKDHGLPGRDSKSFHGGSNCGGLSDSDVINWSFHTLYGTAPRKRKENFLPVKQDECGGSDNEISEKDVQKRIEYIHKTIRGTSFAKEFRERLQSYRRQFDAVLVIGLRYAEGSTVYQPYVKIVYPGLESLGYDSNSVAQLSFPDAETWRPSDCRETYTFVLTNEKGTRVFGYCRRVRPEGGQYSIPVVYCLLSPVLDRAYYFQVLNEIEKRHGLAELKMKSFLQTLQSRNVPQPGRTAVIKCFDLSGETQQIALARSGDYLTDNADVFRLLSHLRVSVLLKVVGTLLMERRAIFFASTPEVLSESIFALLALLHPFRWPHTLVPILPAKMLEVVSSPTPYIVGILSNMRPQLEDISIEEGIMVDLDTSEFLREVGDETTIIPKSIQRAVSVALKLIRNRPGDSEIPKSLLVSEAFLRMFVELVGHYEKHVSTFADEQTIFHREPFCTEPLSNGVRMFLRWFTETQLFDSFIMERTQNNIKDPFQRCVHDMQRSCDDLKLGRRYAVWELGKKMKNFGEKLIGIKSPVRE